VSVVRSVTVSPSAEIARSTVVQGVRVRDHRPFAVGAAGPLVRVERPRNSAGITVDGFDTLVAGGDVAAASGRHGHQQSGDSSVRDNPHAVGRYQPY
jgi:hypothetical protein